MKLLAMVAAVFVAACGTVQASGEGGQSLVVYMVGENLVPLDVCAPGERVATRMFSEIGIHVEWRHRRPVAGQAQREQAMVINISSEIPDRASQHAFASSRPFEGSAITIYYLSLKWAEQRARLAPRLFAHVLVHEIVHNLQQVDRHSETGIMKKHWTTKDLQTMQEKPLRFEPEDIQWIHKGLAERTARGSVLAAAK